MYDVGGPDYQADYTEVEREGDYGYETDENGRTDYDKRDFLDEASADSWIRPHITTQYCRTQRA